MGTKSRRPSASFAWRDRQTYLSKPGSRHPHVPADLNDGRVKSKKGVFTSNVPSQTPSACEHPTVLARLHRPQQSEAAQWLTRETTQHQRLSLGRFEVDWLYPDLKLSNFNLKSKRKNTVNPKKVSQHLIFHRTETKKFIFETLREVGAFISIVAYFSASAQVHIPQQQLCRWVVCVGLAPQRTVSPVTQSNMSKVAERV